MYNIQCKSLKFSEINKDGLNFCKIYVIINIHELYWFGMRGGMSMAVSGIEHVAVVSFDTAALKDWYMDMYGGRVVYDNGKGTYFLQFPDGSMIEFVSAQNEKAADAEKMAGIRHLAFSVSPKAFDEIVAKLKADDRVEEVHDVSENAKGLKTYWYRDIEGNYSHLIYRPDPLG